MNFLNSFCLFFASSLISLNAHANFFKAECSNASGSVVYKVLNGQGILTLSLRSSDRKLTFENLKVQFLEEPLMVPGVFGVSDTCDGADEGSGIQIIRELAVRKVRFTDPKGRSFPSDIESLDRPGGKSITVNYLCDSTSKRNVECEDLGPK